MIILDRKNAPAYTIPGKLNILEPQLSYINKTKLLFFNDYSGVGVSRISLYFNASYQSENKRFLADLCSRLIFSGTKKLNSEQVMDGFDRYGAYVGSESGPEQNVIHLYQLPKFSSQILEHFTDVFNNISFPEEEINIQKSIALQQLQINEEKTAYHARKNFLTHLFGENHIYARFKSAENIENISKEDLISFYEKQYLEGLVKVVVTGEIDEASVKILNNFIAKHQIKQDPIDLNLESYHYKAESIKIPKESANQISLRIGKPFIGKSHHDYKGFLVLNTLLGGYFGSRLMKNIREEKGYTYGIGSGANSGRKGSYFFVSSDLKKEVYEEAIDEIFKEFDRLKNEAVSELELNTVKNYLSGNMLRNFDGLYNQADRYLSVEEYGLNSDYYLELFKTIKKITASEIQILAQKYLNKEDMSIVVSGV